MSIRNQVSNLINRITHPSTTTRTTISRDGAGDGKVGYPASGSAIPAELGQIGRHGGAQERAGQVLPESIPLDRRRSEELDAGSIEKSSFWSKAKTAPGKVAGFVRRGIASGWQALRSQPAAQDTVVRESSLAEAGNPVENGFDANTLFGAREINFSADNVASMSKLLSPKDADILENGAHFIFDADLPRSIFTFKGVRQERPDAHKPDVMEKKQAIFDNLTTLAGGDPALASKLSGLAHQGLMADALGLSIKAFGGQMLNLNTSNCIHVDKSEDGKSYTVRFDYTDIGKDFIPLEFDANGELMAGRPQTLDETLHYSATVEATYFPDSDELEFAPVQFSYSQSADIEFCERRFGMELSTDQQRLWDMCDAEEVDLVKFFKACATGTIDDDTSHQIRAGRNISDQVNALI